MFDAKPHRMAYLMKKFNEVEFMSFVYVHECIVQHDIEIAFSDN